MPPAAPPSRRTEPANTSSATSLVVRIVFVSSRTFPAGSDRQTECATTSSTTSLVVRMVFVRFRTFAAGADGQTGARPRVRPPPWWSESCSFASVRTFARGSYGNECATTNSTTSLVVRIVFAGCHQYVGAGVHHQMRDLAGGQTRVRTIVGHAGTALRCRVRAFVSSGSTTEGMASVRARFRRLVTDFAPTLGATRRSAWLAGRRGPATSNARLRSREPRARLPALGPSRS